MERKSGNSSGRASRQSCKGGSKRSGYSDDYYEGKHSSPDIADVKAPSCDSDEEDARAEREWKQQLNTPNEGNIAVSQDPAARRIVDGFRINEINMRDATNGTIMWESGDWSQANMFQTEIEARVPKEILQCDAVSREINFTSQEEMTNFRLEQRVFFQGVCMEEWFFQFGFVIPGSTNSWQQVIEAADESQMLPASMLSSNVTIETSFFDGPLFVSKSLVRLYYE